MGEAWLLKLKEKKEDEGRDNWYRGEDYDCVAFILDILVPFYFGSLMHFLFCLICGFGEF